MNGYEQTLVIILATMLFINLVLWIIVLAKALQVINRIKSITAKADAIADKAEHVTEFFQKTAAPVAIGRLVANIFESLKKRKGGRKEHKDE